MEPITVRQLHVLAFGEIVAGWYDEACEIWQHGYGRDGAPPVLLLNDGGYSGYGRTLATAGIAPIAGQITSYLIRLYSNDHTQGRIHRDTEFRRDLIAHELGHVYEFEVFGDFRLGGSTHDRPSWRMSIAKATPFMLPDLASLAADAGVPLEDVYGQQERRVRRDPITRKHVRYRNADAIPVQMLARWPHAFRTTEGRGIFHHVVDALARQRHVDVAAA